MISSLLAPSLIALLAQLPPGHPKFEGDSAPVEKAAPALPEGHPKTTPGKAAPSAAELIQQLDATPGLKEREKDFSVASSLGKLYYSQGRFSDAVAFLDQAVKRAEPARELWLKLRGSKPKALAPAECSEPSTSAERLIELSRGFLKSGDAPAAAACAKPAVALLDDMRMLRANALYLDGDRATALTELGRVLDLEPDRAEALFARGVLVIEGAPDDVASLGRAKKDFTRYAQLGKEPWRKERAQAWTDRLDRAIAAGGYSKLAPMPKVESRPSGPFAGAAAAPGSAPPQLDEKTISAVQNIERTPEMEARFDQLLAEGEQQLAKHEFEQARASYRQVMPFRPNDGRVRAGLAWALIGAGAPMGEGIFKVAVESHPDAVERLGDELKRRGDAEGAKKLWSKLAEAAPDYAPKLQAKLQ